MESRSNLLPGSIMSSQISGKIMNCALCSVLPPVARPSGASGDDVVDDAEEKDEGDAAPGATIVV